MSGSNAKMRRAVTTSSGEVHVYPTGKGHDLHRACWCRPIPDRHDPMVIIHNHGAN